MKQDTEKKVYNIEIIGMSLAALYAISCLIFLQYLKAPGFETHSIFYVILFAALLVGSIAVVKLKEWGRKLLVVLNFVMFILIASPYIPQISLIRLSYLFLNVVVFLYFMQSKVKWQFHTAKYAAWNKSILIVDDDEAIIKTLRPTLLSHGYSVLAATSGEDGLQIAGRQKPDLILLDVILPGMKGREVCQRLKENPETKDIPVVFLTAKDSPEDIQAEKEVGAAGRITKPVNMKVLLETILETFGPKASKKS